MLPHLVFAAAWPLLPWVLLLLANVDARLQDSDGDIMERSRGTKNAAWLLKELQYKNYLLKNISEGNTPVLMPEAVCLGLEFDGVQENGAKCQVMLYYKKDTSRQRDSTYGMVYEGEWPHWGTDMLSFDLDQGRERSKGTRQVNFTVVEMDDNPSCHVLLHSQPCAIVILRSGISEYTGRNAHMCKLDPANNHKCSVEVYEKVDEPKKMCEQ